MKFCYKTGSLSNAPNFQEKILGVKLTAGEAELLRNSVVQ